MWLHSLKVAQLLRSAACLHTNQSRSYLNHLVLYPLRYEYPKKYQQSHISLKILIKNNLQIKVLRDVRPCNLIHTYHCFGETCLKLNSFLSRRWRHKFLRNNDTLRTGRQSTENSLPLEPQMPYTVLELFCSLLIGLISN